MTQAEVITVWYNGQENFSKCVRLNSKIVYIDERVNMKKRVGADGLCIVLTGIIRIASI